MMTNEHRELVMSYLYDEMQPEEARAFEQHLAACPPCQRDVADFRQVKQALASWPLEGVPHITVAIQPKQSWLDAFRTFPIWLKLATAAAATMLLLALFNVRVATNAQGGFEFSASLLPPRSNTTTAGANVLQRTPTAPAALTEDQVKAIVTAAIEQTEQIREQKLAAQLAALANAMRAEHQQRLIKLATMLRQEQADQLYELTNQTQRSYTTLTDLLGGSNGNGY
ncbi:MAG: zf-HC2 domain-containing protein [Acidobacteriota bacterium]|nr:zf-HC2 domain-containing protein [Blastocatellia bacterium]MDW8238151.1 zf-HC2 domain-containing protein [Acidobacteriota bacterium]